MATLNISIPDEIAPDLFDALIARAPVNPDGTPPEGTKPAQAKAIVVDHLKTVYRHYMAAKDEQAAGDAARERADELAAGIT